MGTVACRPKIFTLWPLKRKFADAYDVNSRMLRKRLDSGFFFKVKPEGSIVAGYVSFWQSGEGRAGNHQQMDNLLSNKTERDHLINE